MRRASVLEFFGNAWRPIQAFMPRGRFPFCCKAEHVKAETSKHCGHNSLAAPLYQWFSVTGNAFDVKDCVSQVL